MDSDRARRLHALASKQYGVFSHAQAVDLRFTRTEIATRRRRNEWLDVVRAVYVIAGSADTWHRRAMAAVLAAGEGAAVSHEAAAYLHGLIERPPSRIDVTVPSWRRPRGAVHRARQYGPRDVKIRQNIPATCIWRTIVDVAGVASRRRLEDILDSAIVDGLISIESLRSYIRSRSLGNLRGVKMLNRLLDDRETGVPESELEREFEGLLRRFGIELPDRQIRVGDRRVDFIYMKQKVVIELDGRKYHTKLAMFEDDAARRTELVLELPDHLPLQFTWGHVKKRDSWVAQMVRRALER